MARALALVVDPDEARRRNLGAALAGIECEVRDTEQFAQIPQQTKQFRPNLVLMGFSAEEAPAAFAAIEQLHESDRRLPVVVVVGGGSEALAVGALRAGVKDYFCEPVAYASVAASVRRFLLAADKRSAAIVRSSASCPLIAVDASMRQIAEYLARVARHDSTVLITGETGTGKELAAAMIHESSRRRQARFVPVNCAAIPEGLLESELFGHESGAFTGASGRREGLMHLADRGTVFLDEIGDMGAAAQAKILRAIETREIHRVGGRHPVPLDLRIVAATNQDLERAVDEGRFRKDLYFRLNVARVHLPPLRERRSDIGALLDHYLQVLNRERGASVERFAPETRAALENYDWPGNVRELKNLVDAILVTPPARDVTLADLPATFRARLRSAQLVTDAERRRLLDALLAANWNKSRAAEMLRWSRMTVYRKMAKHSVVCSTDLKARRRG